MSSARLRLAARTSTPESASCAPSSARATRRELLRGLVGLGAAAAGGTSCDDGADYTPDDEARLERQRATEAGRSGRFGPLRFRGYRGLAELPWFELDSEGRLRLAAELPPVFDVHVHLGLAHLFAPEVDLLERTPRTRHLLDCDAETPGCALDLDIYMNGNFTPEALSGLRREMLATLLWGGAFARTHTIPNLLDEMEAIGVARAVILPIALRLPFHGDPTDAWLRALEASGAGERLVPFASVHPRDGDWREKLRGFARRGARGVKLHPEMQRFFPDDPEAMEVYAECEALGLPILFHCGRSGIEPRFLRKYALVRRFRAAAEAFPRLQIVLGHGGARDAAEAVALAREYGNLWIGLASLGATQIHEALAALGPERLLLGSDWPFYHQAVSLAKVLVVTRRSPGDRPAILGGNARRLLAL